MFTTSCKCVFPEMLLVSLQSLLCCHPDTSKLSQSQPDEILQQCLSFTSAFLLPVKNHGCVGWFCKDDIPRQEFLQGFQTPAFAFSCEHFHRLHSSFGHPRHPKVWKVVSRSKPSLLSLLSAWMCCEATFIKGGLVWPQPWPHGLP